MMTTLSKDEHAVLRDLLNGESISTIRNMKVIRKLLDIGLIKGGQETSWLPTSRAIAGDYVVVEPLRNDATPMTLAQVDVRHGPTAFIGRTLLAIEEAIIHRGVNLELVPLEVILDFNKQLATDWYPLISIFDPTFHDLDESNAIGIVGRNTNNEIVACQAIRLFEWENTCFVDEAETLRLFYENPEKHRLAGESCHVTTLAGEAITGRVACSGAAWLRRDFRRRGLFPLLPRLARLLALASWDVDLTFSVMARERIEAGALHRPGYPNIEWGIELTGSRVGDVSLSLRWIQREQLLDDAKRLLELLRAQPPDQLEIDL